MLNLLLILVLNRQLLLHLSCLIRSKMFGGQSLGSAMLEEETGINEDCDECYRKCFKWALYQGLNHSKVNLLLLRKWSKFLCSVLHVLGVIF